MRVFAEFRLGRVVGVGANGDQLLIGQRGQMRVLRAKRSKRREWNLGCGVAIDQALVVRVSDGGLEAFDGIGRNGDMRTRHDRRVRLFWIELNLGRVIALIRVPFEAWDFREIDKRLSILELSEALAAGRQRSIVHRAGLECGEIVLSSSHVDVEKSGRDRRLTEHAQHSAHALAAGEILIGHDGVDLVGVLLSDHHALHAIRHDLTDEHDLGDLVGLEPQHEHGTTLPEICPAAPAEKILAAIESVSNASARQS